MRHNAPIIRLLKQIFAQHSQKCITLAAAEMRAEYTQQLKNAGIDFAVVELDGKCACGVFLDVLILDNTSCVVPAAAVEKCINASTVIIYNGDVAHTQLRCRCARISYGISDGCDISMSSAVRVDEGTRIVCCVQKSVADVYGADLEISETAVTLPDDAVNVHHALAAVACAAACAVI